MEFRQVQYFICLYEEGSVTRAAQRLHIVQSALSMQISKLEDEVGQPLFIRTAQGMQPTSEGRRLYGLFLPAVTGFLQARQQVTHPSGELTGQVRLGMISTIARGALVNAVLEFNSVHPKVDVSVTSGFSSELVDSVATGKLDAAIINRRRLSRTLHAETIVEEELLYVTNSDHKHTINNLSFSQLPTFKLVLPTPQHGVRTIIDSFALAEDVELAPKLEIDSISTILKFVSNSDYGTLLPSIAVREMVERGELKAYQIDSPKLRRQIISVTDQRRPLTPAAAEFLTILTRHIKGISESYE